LARAGAQPQPGQRIGQRAQQRPRQPADRRGKQVQEAGEEAGHRASVARPAETTALARPPAGCAGSGQALGCRVPPAVPSPAMLALIQRVNEAAVSVDGEDIGRIDAGLLALVGVEPGDGPAQVERMATRLLGYRVFADAQGRMNLSLADTGGGLLLVSQFTLAADTRSGMRPGFSTAAPPEQAEP